MLIDILDGKAKLRLSTGLLLEYETVLTRPEVLKTTGLDAAEVREVLDELAASCIPVVFDYRWRPVSDDPNDDFVIETAVNGMADAIATFNLPHFRGAASFEITVDNPAAILWRIRR